MIEGRRAMLCYEKQRKKEYLLTREEFNVFHHGIFYKHCHILLQADLTRRHDAYYNVILIWNTFQHRCVERFDLVDGCVTNNRRGLTYSRNFLIYISSMYGLCYAKNKDNIKRKLLEWGVFMNDSVIPLLIYMHVYKTYCRNYERVGYGTLVRVWGD